MRTVLMFVLVLSLCASAREQALPQTVQVQGNAFVTRMSGARSPLASGDIVGPSDQIESLLDGRVTVQFGAENRIVVGPGTRAFLSVTGTRGRRPVVSSVTVNVFAGGVYVSTVGGFPVSVYSPGAVVTCIEGALSLTTDPVSNETGLTTICGDSSMVRNVAQSRGRVVVRGQTTIVRAGAEPSPAEQLNDAHAAMLKQFYGDSLIGAHLERCGVRPAADPTGGSEAPAGVRIAGVQAGGAAAVRPATYRRQFNKNDIYGSILDDRARYYWFYRPVRARGPLFNNVFAVAAGWGSALVGDQGQARISLSPSVSWRILDAALELEIAENYQGWGVPSFSGGIEGVFDLVDHITVGRPRDSLFITIGRLDDYSVANGLVVHRYTNRNHYSLFQPLALYGQARLLDIFRIDGFLADITRFDIGGIHLTAASNGYYAGLGYYYDANQRVATEPGEGNRFVDTPEGFVPDGAREPVHIAEISAGLDIIDAPELRITLSGEAAYRFKTLITSDGYVVRGPMLTVGWKGMQLGVAYHTETRRLTSGTFNWMYQTNRCRVIDSVQVLTQNGVLSMGRETRGIELFYRYLPRPGLAAELEYRQELMSSAVFDDPSVRSRTDFEYYLSIAVNDTLVPFIQLARVSAGQSHGGLYPPGAGFSDTWGFRANLSVLTRPIVYNIAAECRFDYYALDFGAFGDGRVGSDEKVYEVYVGARWGFW